MKNLRRVPYGWQKYTRIGGEFQQEFTVEEPTPQQVRAWVLKIAAAVANDEPIPGSRTFAQEVDDYLAQVRTMPTFAERAYHLRLWCAVFGGKPRHAITAGMIRAQLETWRLDGCAASTVNHRRTALMHLWTVLDGRSAPNPARDVPRYTDPPQPPRALSPQAARALLAELPHGKTKIRLELMLWTGWPQKQIGQLQPEDINAKARTVFIRGRRKGKGVEGTWLPLLPAAWRALQAFQKARAWGAFSTGAMRTMLRKAAIRVRRNPRLPKAVRDECRDVTPYQFRHTFGTLAAAITRDDRAVQTLMLHKDIRQTHRYTSATVEPRTLAAVKQMAKTWR